MVVAESFLFAFPLLSLVASIDTALIPSVGIATNNASDHLALLSFKSLIRTDPLQALESWGNRSIPICQWRGVTCGRRGHARGRVTALDLGNLSLVGAISSSVANLTFLRRLHLPGNHLHGAIPSVFGHLLYMKHLNLSDNSLNGEIPVSISQSRDLENISIESNSLQGDIPRGVGSLHNLKVLNLGYNNLTGTIPVEISNLLNLESLHIPYNMLTGEIPTGIGNLVKLSMLSLGSNQLTGSIPDSLGNLSSLVFLILHTNNLTGSIPTLQSLSSLAILELGENDLTGCIPLQLGNLTSLEFIDLQINSFIGSIPESLGNLNLLELLDLSTNNLTGSVPNSIGSMHLLSELDLDNNNLEGPLPSSLFNCSNLEILDLQNNYYLNGSLALEMGNNLPNLQFFVIDHNQFQGSIPPFLCNASMLQMIQVANNLLTGTIPNCLGINLKSLYKLNLAHNNIQATKDDGWGFLASLTNCTELQYLILGRNMLEGEIPSSIGNLSINLEYIFMEFNHITGKIPDEIANLVNLNMLSLPGNHLAGTIPSSLGKLRRLNGLYLGMNKLSGPIPPTIGNLTKLSILNLYGNTLTGSIPSSLIGCPLQNLDLSQNSLIGPIPKELFLINTLSNYLYIQNNILTGTLPELGNLTNLGTLDFSGNQISGEIPVSLGACQTLQYLNASKNNLEGTIPPSVEQMKGLLVIDLSYNNLSGGIPEFLGNMKGLCSLNISFNNFKGQVPEDGIFCNASSVAIEGNNGLCAGIPQLKLPPCSNYHTKRPSLSLVIAISVGSASLFCIFAVFIFFHWNKKTKMNPGPSTIISDNHARVSYAELAHATDSFHPGNLIGVGSFGSVFKGKIMVNKLQVTVAVKVINLLQPGASHSFYAECQTLRGVRHRNLVKILTVCSGVDLRGLDFKALVYQFLPNGNLEQWLYQPVEEDGEYKVLDLIQRLDICIDVASALEYLHQHKPLPIIHCDLKPSNILLDNDMVAHVGDFGLARFYHQDSNESSEISSAWVRMRGTTGYAAPEYGLGNEVSTHGDVYSYGILLLEMFTRKRPTSSEFGEDFSLHKYVKVSVPDQVASIVDQQLLRGSDDNKETTPHNNRTRDTEIACITSILHIGISCSKETPTERTEIVHALKGLQTIRDKFRRESLQDGASSQ